MDTMKNPGGQFAYGTQPHKSYLWSFCDYNYQVLRWFGGGGRGGHIKDSPCTACCWTLPPVVCQKKLCQFYSI